MEPKSHRTTRFPGGDQLASSEAREKFNNNRQTRFPGGTELQKISILEDGESPTSDKAKAEEATQIPSRLLLRVNPPDGAPAKPLPTTTIRATQPNQPLLVRTESPWNTYTSLRTLERGGEVIAACRREVPVEMVAVKKLSSDYIKELANYQHENLLATMGLYRFEGVFFVITAYTAATLKQIIAIPLHLEELHISATCRQESSLPGQLFTSLTFLRSLKGCSTYLGLVSHTGN
jgi:hypothetical protein